MSAPLTGSACWRKYNMTLKPASKTNRVQVADNKLPANKANNQAAKQQAEQQVAAELSRKRPEAPIKQAAASESSSSADAGAAGAKGAKCQPQQQHQVNGNADASKQTEMRAGNDKALEQVELAENGTKQVHSELEERACAIGATQEPEQENEQENELVVRAETSDEVEDDDEDVEEDDRLSSSGAASRRKMFVGGLSWQTGPEGLRDHFGQFGEITEVMIMNDPATRRSR